MKHFAFGAAALLAVSALALPAQAAGAVQHGFLVCQVAGGEGMVFGSTKTVDCTYTPSNSSLPRENYTGVISRFGVDLGFTRDGLLKWAVLAKNTDGYETGALAGQYIGAGSEVTVAVGLGSNVLVSKTTNNWVLQPLSVSGQSGLNIALGIAEFELIGATK
jgi:hypothetical protein